MFDRTIIRDRAATESCPYIGDRLLAEGVNICP
jgi:hypothetical protein